MPSESNQVIVYAGSSLGVVLSADTYTNCVGTFITVKEPTIYTMEVRSSQVNAGTATETNLYTSISNVLMSICPPPTVTTAMMGYNTGTVAPSR
ncbi:hypothetical protein NHQ30_009846 [Ciborinia camelliae]|nr:hypothetical protein NHQ30_009846 [Ciborinia camelliae]